MHISYSWLQEFIKLPTKISAQEVADRLTAHTVEVESVLTQADKFDKVVVGNVLTVEKHPNADKLRLASVDIQTKKLHIVCGAPNLAVGQMVPVALDGAILPGDFEIKTTNIRGELSEGMICAEEELGLGESGGGIMVLDKKAKAGQSLAEYLDMKDIVFEVDNKSLSNRPDLLCHYGLARELSAIFETRLKLYDKIIAEKKDLDNGPNKKLIVEVLDKQLCPRYSALRIDGIKVQESPAWLKNRLIAVNQRPINNIVDLTNYVMFELGQPLHAFDASGIKKLKVRAALKGETIESLDQKERELVEGDLVIADEESPIAIAGIMGGKNSEIDSSSTSMILESANFQASSIRKTAQRLGLRTEASLRFEKSLDPEMTIDAVLRFVYLLRKICPQAKIVGTVFDIYQPKETKNEVFLGYEWLTSKVGQEIPRDQIASIFSHLGFKVSKQKTGLDVAIPSWRATKDVSIKEDLAEEVLRIYGYDKIKPIFPMERLAAPLVNHERMWERKIKDILVMKFNFSETHNYSFVGSEQLKKLNIDFFNHLRLVNPLSEVHSMLRQSLVPGLVGNIKNNQAREGELRFLEIGSTFFNASGEFSKGSDGEEKVPYQEKRLGLALAGRQKDIFQELKDVIVNFFQEILISTEDISFSNFENAPGWADSKVCARISLGDEEIGWIGLLSREAREGVNIKMRTALAEINLEILLKILYQQPERRFRENPKFPPIIRDLSFVVSDKILYNDIKKEISSFHGLIKSEELLDVYVGDKLDKKEKSLTFRLLYQSDERTLTSQEVDEIQAQLMAMLAQKLEAKIRDF